MTEPLLVPDWLSHQARNRRDHPAVIGGGRPIGYGTLARRARSAAATIHARGVRRGHRVGVLIGNRPAFVEIMHGLMRLGAVIVPLNPRLAADETARLLDHCGATLVLCDPESRQRSADLERLGAPPPLCFNGETAAQTTAAQEEAPPGIDLAAVHSIIYTSGSAGRPKGVLLSYGNHLWSAIGSAFRLGLRTDDRWLVCLPVCHVGGLAILLRCLIYGTTAVLHDGFDAERVNHAIDWEGVTLVSVVANMLQRMIEARRDRPYPASLRCVLVGGGPVPQPLLKRCLSIGLPVAQTYGLTEAASQVTTLHPRDAACRLGSSGTPLPVTEVAILSPEGAAPAETVGDIAVRGPTISRGYAGNPEPQRRPTDWFRTEDQGWLDADGFLYVAGRRDDVIISGGENIHPAEIEAVLQSHPDVEEACVYGLADPQWGQAVTAGVRLRAGATTTPDHLISHARRFLAAFKVPRAIYLRTDFPRTAAGKILRRQVREEAPTAAAPPAARNEPA